MQTVSVAIICHNYGRFLREAVDSVLAQTLPPREVLIVDDASTDNTAAVARDYARRGVRYERVDTGCVWTNRLRACEQLRGQWVLCLDADNKLPARYLSAALEAAGTDPRCGVVFPSLVRFGLETGFVNFAHPPLPVSVANHIDATAVYRREAVLQSIDRQVTPDLNITAEDWLLARQVTASGWTAAHNAVPALYRVHDTNKHAGKSRHYYNDAGLMHEPISIVLPLSGRRELWPMMQNWLETQTWPRHQCRLHIVDNSHQPDFSQTVRQWLARSDYLDARYTHCPAGRRGLAEEPRTGRRDHDRQVHQTVAAIYNRAFRESPTDYILAIEDDIEPPADLVERLLRDMQPAIGCVSGAYRHRNGEHWMAWRGTARRHEYLEPCRGVEIIDGAGFGCLLFRKLVMDGLQFQTDGPTPFYDANAFEVIGQQGWQVAIDWSARCQHHAEVL